jgi:hypothetical protein
MRRSEEDMNAERESGDGKDEEEYEETNGDG